MTPKLLDELEKIVALSEKATPGPWMTGDGGTHEPATRVYCDDAFGSAVATCHHEYTMAIPHAQELANADLIAASINFLRTHAPALADMAKRMEAAERDAARYRWLRSRVDWKPLPESSTGKVYLVATMVSAAYGDVNDQVDAAIDAATQEGEG